MSSPGHTTLARLRHFAAVPKRARCDLCTRELQASHEHLLSVDTKRLSCACGSCAALFEYGTGQRYARVARRASRLALLDLADQEWNMLGVPVALACLIYREARSEMEAAELSAIYPSPAGVIEARLPTVPWHSLRARHAVLRSIAPDLEALLVDRTRRPARYFAVSVDICFEFAGVMRAERLAPSSASRTLDQLLNPLLTAEEAS